MEHTTYLDALRAETERFLDALGHTEPDTPVPTCAGWTAVDLLRHVAHVQHFWTAVVRDGLAGPDVPEPAEVDDLALPQAVARAGTALGAALAAREPEHACWSWFQDGGSAGWVARRQAHEALIHRVDAELTAGRPVTPPTVELAADGVDEMITVMLDGVPGDGELTLDGSTARLACTDADASWVLAMGRFTGTDGTTDALDVAVLVTDDDGGADDVVVTGAAWDLDRWLWGRGPLDALTVEGDERILARLRVMASEATQ